MKTCQQLPRRRSDHPDARRSQGGITATGFHPGGTLRPVGSIDLLFPSTRGAEVSCSQAFCRQRPTLLGILLQNGGEEKLCFIWRNSNVKMGLCAGLMWIKFIFPHAHKVGEDSVARLQAFAFLSLFCLCGGQQKAQNNHRDQEQET